ncbi:MAG: GyrI-like domain-containing protein [Clostridiales bacterium]|nr:GyrI-like domain-containing protein [Clostridiales bacterium]
MPRISSIELMRVPPVKYVGVTRETALGDMPAAIGEGFFALGEYVKSRGEILAGAPFIRVIRQTAAESAYELCFPVAAELPGEGGITPGTYSADMAAYALYRGPYAGIAPLRGEMDAWMSENAFAPAGGYVEACLNGPDVPEEELTMVILRPVRFVSEKKK